MPRDSELGLDPYQQKAINCARQGAALCVLLVLCAFGLYTYADSMQDPQQTRLLAALAFLTGLSCFLLANKKLKKEDIAWADCGV
jgi:hypothetical protein